MAKKPQRRVVPLHELPPKALAESARNGTDLACALICGAYVENATGSLLESAMINDQLATNGLLNNPTGALSTAGARADVCYCLALIDKATHENAKQIAKVRNAFAHSHKPIDFNSEEIKGLCSKLVFCLVDHRTGRNVEATIMKRIFNVPRYRLVLAACCTFLDIMHSAYNEPFQNEAGEVTWRLRKHPVSHPGRFLVKTDGKSVFDTIVLFDD